MHLIDIPYKFGRLWAALASPTVINDPIPDVPPGGGAASRQLGFPPITATQRAAGGIPPSIGDFNGVLKYITGWAQWQQAGGAIIYDAAFQAQVGGYPQYAIIMSSTTPGTFWMSIVDNNVTNPDSGGAGWVRPNPAARGQQLFKVNGTFTAPNYVFNVYAECWGAGAGGANNLGGGGDGGGYAADWVATIPGNTYAAVCGVGGIGGNFNGVGQDTSTNGTNSTFGPITAFGGVTSGASRSPTTGGTGAALIIIGSQGVDLDGVTINAPGGNSPRGGMGGSRNGLSGGVFLPTEPGGGGGANTNNSFAGGNGANGWVRLSW